MLKSCWNNKFSSFKKEKKKFFYGGRRWEKFAASKTWGSGLQRKEYQAPTQKVLEHILLVEELTWAAEATDKHKLEI